MIPKNDITKFKYELDNIFRVNINSKIKTRTISIFVETINNNFE